MIMSVSKWLYKDFLQRKFAFSQKNVSYILYGNHLWGRIFLDRISKILPIFKILFYFTFWIMNNAKSFLEFLAIFFYFSIVMMQFLASASELIDIGQSIFLKIQSSDAHFKYQGSFWFGGKCHLFYHLPQMSFSIITLGN